MSASDPALLSATELVSAYRAKTLSPVEVTRACLDRIERLDPAINGFCLVDAEAAIVDARASEARWTRGEPMGLVDGVPATIKDLVLTKGWPTLRGSKTVHNDGKWDEDAPSTERLRAHGAVLLGKTTTPEFGHKGVTNSPLTGLTRNPWNPGTHCGGSSGGAATAAALGMGALHVGTDGAGSVRIPGAFTGIFAHKPSFGRIPIYPPSPFMDVSHVGPMTRTVADAALMMNVLAGADARDWMSLPSADVDYAAGLGEGVKGMRIAFAHTINRAPVEPAIIDLVRKAVGVFVDLGATVEEVTLDLPNAKEIEHAIWVVGAAVTVGRMTEAQRAEVDPTMLDQAAQGRATDMMTYAKLMVERAALGRQMAAFHQTYDLLLTPTLPVQAFGVEKDHPYQDGPTEWIDWLPFTYPFNLTKQPAATIPCGLTPDGLPAGLQIVGPMFDDVRVLNAAAAYEAVHPIALPPMANA